ncbi:hypothetical protein SERLA73DRAFT_77381 [Serpula lacrymans var. lacrymans S7.3]|uniref:FAD/NAD(P)-binding domain-containing protein n=2 Tax=Serpula lacrymans var. lacrymans TaxID=341189 RepID=F8QA29_SERL3|nr:uncharacterized protein SERLADRAFT_442258 [Serpula lacrymans var. lacrymans S7.9]EGN94619.1 hypothetical protein SERLA73DRAFT_77381 [Serpula lacrymans var. lacrymans S7.3]EGO20099.1 hypothetical protein SERLADRAFT_442258 [Serpula lacrymans var. lacrymans S7.9]
MAAKTVCVVGSGAAGLITAKTLLDDGFAVEILSKDRTAGGVWAADRVYPGLYTNNVNGEYEFSAMPMHLQRIKERPSGTEMRQYMEAFADRFLNGKIRFNTQVVNIHRWDQGNNQEAVKGWAISVQNSDGTAEQLFYDIVVLCSGGCSLPRIPPELSSAAAQKAGFVGQVVHSFEFASRLDDIISAVKPIDDPNPGHVVVVGGGKSAQDIAAYLANEGRKVSIAFETADGIIAAPIPLPHFIRKSRQVSTLIFGVSSKLSVSSLCRLLGLMATHIHLRTALEKFLHTTWLGSKIVSGFWDTLSWASGKFLSIPSTSPLLTSHSLFWGIRTNDEGSPRSNGFHALVNAGKIQLVASNRVSSFGPDGHSVVLRDGSSVRADVVVLSTGYTSSWKGIFDEEILRDFGLERVRNDCLSDVGIKESEWQFYKTLQNPPQLPLGNQGQWMSSIYRGLVPARNIQRRDFAINGAVFTTSPAHIFEVSSHWISSYLLSDPFLRLPSSPEDALVETERVARWVNIRNPGMLKWVNESYSSGLNFFDYAQASDDLLEDMGLPILRSGGNWFTWPFIPISSKEIKALGEERAILRASNTTRN